MWPEATQDEIRPRLDVACLPEGSARLDALRRGFATLRARPAHDPRSLAFQSGLLNGLAALTSPAERVYFTWRFLPWQRGYLYFFERLLREAAGDATLSLPYWDWSVELRVPAQFWGSGNPLDDPNRIATPESTLDARQVATSGLLACPAFAALGGQADTGGALELGPHDYVHRFVGHDMGGQATEGNDPLSFAHHAAVDRLFWIWSREPAHRLPLHEPAWSEQRFTYYDVDARPVSLSVREILALPCAYAPYVANFEVLAPGSALQLVSEPVTLTSPPFPEALRRRLYEAESGWLRLGGILRPVSEPTTVRVFLGAGATSQSPMEEPDCLGSFTLQPVGDGAQAPGSVNLDATWHLDQLAAEGALTLTLVPVGLDPSRPGIGPIVLTEASLHAASA